MSRESIASSMRLIQADCKTDAEAIDQTPFTARGVGPIFGNLLAMITTLARAVELLAEEKKTDG